MPKPVNVTHEECERALQAWTKWQRADSLSDNKHPPKPVNQGCERHICRKLFCRLTLELSRPNEKTLPPPTTWGRLERIVRWQAGRYLLAYLLAQLQPLLACSLQHACDTESAQL
jgi:hypothetical protein